MTTITLRRCKSEKIHLTKEFVADADIALQGEIKTEIDILNPILQIKTSTDLSLYNYIEIPLFNRKYFCNCRGLQGNMWEINCHVDVLSTYASEIKACKAFVQRTASESKTNYYMNDGAFYPEQRTVTTYHTFKDGGAITRLNDWQYYLIAAGK